jgi:hypothetical protein
MMQQVYQSDTDLQRRTRSCVLLEGHGASKPNDVSNDRRWIDDINEVGDSPKSSSAPDLPREAGHCGEVVLGCAVASEGTWRLASAFAWLAVVSLLLHGLGMGPRSIRALAYFAGFRAFRASWHFFLSSAREALRAAIPSS